MKRDWINRLGMIVGSACLLVAGFSTAWAQQNNLQVVTVVEKEEVFINEEGEQETRMVPVSTVVPGDNVVYTITIRNVGDKAAENITITDPIPNELVYVDESAFGAGMEITFSINNGESYAPKEALVVVDESGEERPAKASEYTHIRWVMRDDLPPGGENFARFRAKLQ